MQTIVIDTNVFIAALMSRRGASHHLLNQVGTGRFNIVLSVPLVLEYEAVAERLQGEKIMLSKADIANIINYLCKAGKHQQIFYLWRPFLPDLADDLVLELAVNAQADSIITFNERDFRGSEQFGIKTQSPRAFLNDIEEHDR
jgi:putative PIN family toxin of toxin-antitoxin system